MNGPEKTNYNQSEIDLKNQIRKAAALAYDVNRLSNQLFTVNSLLAQRSLLALYIDKGLLKNEVEAIEQFKYLTNSIKQHLNLL